MSGCISQIDAGLTHLKELLPLLSHTKQEGEWIHELHLHSNSIHSLDMDILSMLSKLRILDLSSNDVYLSIQHVDLLCV